MKKLKRLDPAKTGSEAEKLRHNLKKMVIGQHEAVDQIVNVYQTWLAGMNSPGRPIGNLLFLGPTGTGKTRLVEAVAQNLVGNERAVLKVDCAEFQHSHEIAKLIGSPPGYLGHRETRPILSEESLTQFQTGTVKISFVLFDEIEKASDALWHLLLGILDKGTLTLGDNSRVDFSQSLIFMTSNLGAAEMSRITKPSLGFASGETERTWAKGEAATLQAKAATIGVEAARRKFTPEFMNRIDKVVVFQTLGKLELDRILTLELSALRRRIQDAGKSTAFSFVLTTEAREHLLQEGTDLKYGARHLKRVIERLLVHQLSNLIASGQARAGDNIRVDFDAEVGTLVFERDLEGQETENSAKMIGAAA